MFYFSVCLPIFVGHTNKHGSVACSLIANVGNSTEERIGRHLAASYPFVGIGVGLLLILSSRFPTTCNHWISFQHHAFCFYKSNLMNRRSGAGTTMNLSSMKRLLLLVSILWRLVVNPAPNKRTHLKKILILRSSPQSLISIWRRNHRGTCSIECSSQFAWSPSPSKPDWLKMSATSSGFTFSAQENKTFYARGAMLMIYTNEINGKVSQSHIDFYQIGKPQN